MPNRRKQAVDVFTVVFAPLDSVVPSARTLATDVSRTIQAGVRTANGLVAVLEQAIP